MKRYYKDDDLRWKIYFDKAQKLIIRKKYIQCVNMYYGYHRIEESMDNLKLFLLVLFIENKTERFSQLYKRNEIDSDIFLTMFKYSLAHENEFDELNRITNSNDELDVLFSFICNKDNNETRYHECLNILRNTKDYKIKRILDSITSSEE